MFTVYLGDTKANSLDEVDGSYWGAVVDRARDVKYS